jgi:polyphosphate kinase
MAIRIRAPMTTHARLVEPVAGPEEQRYLNRELSWLDFNERVLELGADARLPLLERAKFLAIFASGLDEFYQIRVAGLKRQLAAGVAVRSADGLTPSEQLAQIGERVGTQVERHAEVFTRDVRKRLGRAGIRIRRWRQLDDDQRESLTAAYMERIFPVLTPLAVDPGHPFPYISNLSLNLAVWLRDPSSSRRRFARVKVPPLLPRFLAPAADSGGVLVPLEDVIAANLESLFPGMTILESWSFRVTRHSDIEVDDDEAEDLLQAVEDRLRHRRRFSPAVRLEVETDISDDVLDLLVRELQLEPGDVHRLPAPLGLADLWSLHGLPRPDLKDPPFVPVTRHELRAGDEDEEPDVFALLQAGDLLLHHPYDSFTSSTQLFVEQAAADPSVLAIKQTLYRTSGESPIVNALVSAAESGKQVVVLVEIKARGDEPANIAWARTLERAGCHVVYGMVGLKTHAKLCLVVRQEGRSVRRYVHIGTGNYNPATARIYEDIGLLTADPTLGADVNHLFNLLTGYSRRSEYERLIVAPLNMRRRVVEMIEREAALSAPGRPGRIIFKLNNLIDEAVIDALYVASQAGVEIDLVVRGICALRPGVPGLSNRIQVRSILGRYLEHSRIFWFDNGDAPEVWMGSADMMHRNLDRRVETLVRVDDPGLRDRLRAMLELALADEAGTWTLDARGRWTRLQSSAAEPMDLQAELRRRAVGG